MDEGHRIELGEGQTPLIRSRSIGAALGLENLYFKLENLNPTGSYKDRFAAAFVSHLVASGQRLCVCTSSGNTGAALAAYCAAANITCFVATVDGAPLPKIRQMQVYGARIFLVRKFGKDPAVTQHVFEALDAFARSRSLPLPVSAYHYCPEGMVGVETIAFEIIDEMKDGPDHIFSPSGGGGLTLAMAKGINRYHPSHQIKIHCVQPEGNNTIAGPLRNGAVHAQRVTSSSTSVSGLQVPSVIDGDEVIRYCRQSGGNGYLVTDENVFLWHRKLAQEEGIFCEPAGAVALTGVVDALKRKEVSPTDKVVCLVTGSGFKDMASVASHFNLPAVGEIETISVLNHELSSL